ncbi:MAG: hypothetical protein K6G75_04785 [Lachnospiraceae bacterium]|nr:hypothetical protein [Lachnospiraceae bacterium]
MKEFLKKTWMIVPVAVWFVASLFFFEYMLNRGNTDLTREMSEASLPVVNVRMNGHDINRMFGYTEDMDYSLIRDGVTLLEEGRKLNVRIDKKNAGVEKISYELRSIDKNRFVEEGEIKDFIENKDYIDAVFSFKDIIADNTDYSLKIILTLDDEKQAYYYARIYKDDELGIIDKIDYVYYFNNCTFDKDNAQEEIGKYMESNSSGDNTDFAHVNIHSSMEQVTWGNLDVKMTDEPVCTIMEVDSKSALMKLEYNVGITNGDDERYYSVREYYRFIKGKDRMYLLSFDRYMDTLIQSPKGVVFNDKLMLGITEKEFEHAESEDGNTYAFVKNGALFVVNSVQNVFNTAYSFYDENNFDERCTNNSHEIKIINVDEAGNVLFYVYGYFNRGDHEGKCGINLFEYNAKINAVEEKIFIECDRPYEALKEEVGRLAFANTKDEFYFYYDEKIYRVNLENRSYETVVESLKNENLYVCDGSNMCAWISKEDLKGATEITFLRMDTSTTYEIRSESSEHIKALGFMGEDLIFGKAYNEDISENIFGEIIFPMYEINIINKNKDILKKYNQENIYTLSCKINNNLITLTRNEKDENGELVYAAPDSIVNSLMEKTYKNNSEIVVTENLKKIVQVTLKKEMDNKKMKFRTPKTEIQEGLGKISIETDSEGMYYAFVGDECLGIFRNISNAVNKANENFGCIIDCDGHYLWKKENYRGTNQIMRLDAISVTDENSTSLENCIEKILEYEGFSLDIKNDLKNGESCEKILSENIPDSMGIELTNCNPELIKYYLNKDIPVIAEAESNTVLIVGYSESVYVWLNPGSGNLMKVSKDEAESFYENYGFRFATYVKWTE